MKFKSRYDDDREYILNDDVLIFKAWNCYNSTISIEMVENFDVYTPLLSLSQVTSVDPDGGPFVRIGEDSDLKKIDDCTVRVLELLTFHHDTKLKYLECSFRIERTEGSLICLEAK